MTAPRVHRLGVFAVEDTTAQLTWSALGPGPVKMRAGDTSVEVEADGGPGAVVLSGLPVGAPVDIEVTGEGVPKPVRVSTRTLASPPGAELARLATIGDLHIGASAFGFRERMVEEVNDAVDLHPVRCTRAAVAEARAWGAGRLVVKGDLTHDGRPFQWDWIGPVLAGAGMPVHVVAGNHDRSPRRKVEPSEALRSYGLTNAEPVEVVDLLGLRLLLADTCRTERHGGTLTQAREPVLAALREAKAAKQPALLALHHQLQSNDHTQTWPPGIPKAEADEFLDRAAEANPALFVTSGHTHRHRRRHHGPVTLTQVGSTKDHPGVWAGYVVHEGGIRQVVRRVSEPSCIAWTDRTGDALCRLWRYLGAGRLKDRCFTEVWPAL